METTSATDNSTPCIMAKAVHDDMALRKQHPTREVSIGEDFQGKEHLARFELADWTPNRGELHKQSELRSILSSALQELQPSLRVVLVLCDVEGLSNEQTAEVLALIHAALKARL